MSPLRICSRYLTRSHLLTYRVKSRIAPTSRCLTCAENSAPVDKTVDKGRTNARAPDASQLSENAIPARRASAVQYCFRANSVLVPEIRSFDARLSDHLVTIFVCFSTSGAGEKRVLCVISAMRSRGSFASKALVILAFVCAISTSTVAEQSLPPGRVVVKRDPGFGWNLAFRLHIDGRPVATIGRGHHYDDWLPAGRHLLTVITASYVGLPEPTSTIVNIEPGGTHVFTAIWDSNLIFLRPAGGLLTPGKQWELRPH
jgi:hypothetical protein